MHAFSPDKFDDMDYLKTGTAVQQVVYDLLKQSKLLEKLKPFDPLLVGTIPIDIDIASSDLDIICFAEDLDAFSSCAEMCFSRWESFRISSITCGGLPTVLVRFMLASFEVELFAQPLPVKLQNAYRHMIKEYEILASRGAAFREQVIRLKDTGMKTEPAFAQLLGIKGDPYVGLLNYKNV